MIDRTGIDKGEHSIHWHKQHHTNLHQAGIGLEIAEMMGLVMDTDGRYLTAWGTKTPLGLYLSVQRIISDS